MAILRHVYIHLLSLTSMLYLPPVCVTYALVIHNVLFPSSRHKKCVQKLVEAGADISVHDNEGLTAVSPCLPLPRPLHYLYTVAMTAVALAGM